MLTSLAKHILEIYPYVYIMCSYVHDKYFKGKGE